MKAYKAKYNGELPAYTSADQYAAIQLMAAAINKAKSTDVAAVRAALSGLKADTVLGTAEVRAQDHQTSRPILMNEIVKGPDGKATYRIKQRFPRARNHAPGGPGMQNVRSARSDVLDSRAAVCGRRGPEGLGLNDHRHFAELRARFQPVKGGVDVGHAEAGVDHRA